MNILERGSDRGGGWERECSKKSFGWLEEFFDNSGGKKQLVGTFRRQNFCKCIRCIILEVSCRSKGHNL